MADESIVQREQTLQELALEKLTPEEHVELERYRRSGKPGLAVKLAMSLYESWLNGVSCEKLAGLNPGLSLGVILMTRVDHLWDARRDAYLSELYSGANDRLKQIGSEALNFMGLALAAVNKEQGAKYAKYLQTGDPADLGVMRILSWSQYKSVIETIARLTGADRPKSTPPVAPQQPDPVSAAIEVKARPLTPEEADRARALRAAKRKMEDQ